MLRIRTQSGRKMEFFTHANSFLVYLPLLAEDLQVEPTARKSDIYKKPRAVLRMPENGRTAIGKAVIK